ncbi:MAG: hypothetical protein P1P85_03965 [Patescibacteria group bacterium]|nr:hypothetical protein [Patescibacteria group bacterium]
MQIENINQRKKEVSLGDEVFIKGILTRITSEELSVKFSGYTYIKEKIIFNPEFKINRDNYNGYLLENGNRIPVNAEIVGFLGEIVRVLINQELLTKKIQKSLEIYVTDKRFLKKK